LFSVNTKRSYRWGALVALIVLGWLLERANADAAVFGNPVPLIHEGERAAGISLGDDGITIFGDFGVGKDGVARAMVGTVERGRSDGLQIGGAYTQRLETKAQLDTLDIHFGVFTGARYGELDGGGGDASFVLVDVGGGATISPVAKLYCFGGPVLRWLHVNSDGGKGKGGDGSDTSLGLFIGAEYWLQPQLAAGAEMHGGIKDESLSIYVGYKF
jgi:hypothetical protein